MTNPVMLQTFMFRHEAEIAKTDLEAYGIEAFVKADDCGGMDPCLNFGKAVQLFVDEKDLEEASGLILK